MKLSFHARLSLLFATVAVMGMAVSGCSEDTPTGTDDPTVTLKPVQVRFVPMFGDRALDLGTSYVNAAGDTVMFTGLSFYASEFALVGSDGSEVPMDGLDLVDFSDPTVADNGYYEVEIMGTPGTYSGLKFSVGVPFDENHRDVSTQELPLGPNSGMYWGWNPGYIFFKVEGRVDSMGTPVDFLFHTGEDNRRKTVRMASVGGDNLTEFTVAESGENVMTLKVDYARFFERGVNPAGPLSLKMNPGERRNHVGPVDLADRTAANFATMFSQMP